MTMKIFPTLWELPNTMRYHSATAATGIAMSRVRPSSSAAAPVPTNSLHTNPVLATAITLTAKSDHPRPSRSRIRSSTPRPDCKTGASNVVGRQNAASIHRSSAGNQSGSYEYLTVRRVTIANKVSIGICEKMVSRIGANSRAGRWGMPRRKSFVTVIRELVQEEVRRVMAGLLGTAAPKKPAKNGRRRRRRGPGRPPGSKNKPRSTS
jgi:hypothetical protein